MTDRNGKPLKVGDKVKHCERPEHTGVVEDTGVTGSGFHWANVMFDDGIGWLGCDTRNLTPVEPKPKPEPEPVGYKADGTPIDLGGIPVVTSEAVPKGEAYIWNPAKMKEFLGTEKGKEILDKVKAPNPVVTALMGQVESQTFQFPLPEPDYKGMYEDSRELVRKLTRAAVAVLTAPDGIEKAGAYARLREAVKEAL